MTYQLISKKIISKKTKTYFAIISLSILLSSPMHAMQGGSFAQELYQNMNYEKIFKQEKILSKYPEVLKKEGLKIVKPTTQKEKRTCLNTLKKMLQYAKNDKKIYSHSKQNKLQEISIAMSGLKGLEKDLEYLTKSKANKTSRDLDNALLKDFKAKKRAAMMHSLYQPLFSSGVYGTTMYLISRLLKNERGEKNELGEGIGIINMGYNIANAVNRLSKTAYSMFISPIGDPLEKFEIKYATCKRFLSKDLQGMIEDALGVARKSPQALKSTVKFTRIALNLPLKSKKLKSLVESQQEVNELLGCYDDNIAETIELKFFNHYARFSQKLDTLDSPKTVIYLLGPPGIGKTHITEEISKLMKATIIRLKATDNIQSIIGSQDKPGSFLEAICKNDVERNAIILIDEIDHVVNKENSALQLFLPLLEPDAKYFYSPYLKANIDISHFCFVLAGNSPLKNKALKSRVTTIEIKKLKHKTKEKIINKMLSKEITENELFMSEVKKLIKNNKEATPRALRGIINDEIRRLQMKQQKENLNKIISSKIKEN